MPLESYRIIQDEARIVTEYLIAVYALVEEWAELQSYVQELWRQVAYNDLVAGAVANIAFAMVKRTESSIFVDFPGHNSLS